MSTNQILDKVRDQKGQKIIDYEIITSGDQTKLRKLILAHLLIGYELYGHPFECMTFLCQAVIKKENT